MEIKKVYKKLVIVGDGGSGKTCLLTLVHVMDSDILSRPRDAHFAGLSLSFLCAKVYIAYSARVYFPR